MMNEKRIQRPKDDFAEIDFGDKRLNKRLQKLVEDSTQNAEKSILGSAGGRNEAKACYRLLGNEKFDIEQLLGFAGGATLNRMSGTVLLIQDTSDINLNGHKKTKGLGYCSEHVRGISLHSCIAVSPEGMPLGLVTQSYGTRQEAKSSLSRGERTNRPIEEKESFRWIETLREATAIQPDGVHFVALCDREGDFYELYAEAKTLEVDFVIRVTHDRCSDTNERIVTNIRKKSPIGQVTVTIPRDSRRGIPEREAEMEVAYCQVNVLKPATLKGKELASMLTINLVRITDKNPPDDCEPIEWILATSLPIYNASNAMTVVEYYIQRWKIERFHFILKSGCNAEKIQQHSYERIKPMLLIYSVIAMFIMSVTYIGRVLPNTLCDLYFDEDEWKSLYRITHKTKFAPEEPYTMAEAIKYLGQLGGFKRAPSDGFPGLQSIWRGLLALYFAIDILATQN